ncbi:MAG: ABC transporter substrate-binding protein [Defluviitaleaceae bacterium]|nr:ABC transporter substrate-binding protein [Defluviitaleaceae bacterium]
MMKFLLLAVLLLVLSACGGESPELAQLDPDFATFVANDGDDQPDETHNQEQESDVDIIPTFDNHLNIAMPLPRTLNPLLNSDPYLAQVLRLIFEPIVIFDESLQPVANPAIIESIVFAPSGQSLTITLHQNIFWEDGTPITSADIAFTIDVLRHQSPATAVYRPNVAYIVSHNAVDIHSLHINLRYPMWQMKYLLDFPIIPREYYQPVSMTNLTHPRNMHPVGNGSFRFYDYILASRLELIPNTNAPGGRPLINGVTAHVLRDMSDVAHAFEGGVVDVLSANATDWGRFRATGKNEGGIIASRDFDFIGFNHNRTIFAERDVRVAIASVLDWDGLLARYYHGAERAFAPLNPLSWLSVNIEQPAYTTFAHAGFVLGDDGFLQRQASPALPPMRLTLDIIVNEENATSVNVAQLLARGLLDEGAYVELHILPSNQFQTRLNNGNFDLVVGTTTLSNHPTMDFIMGYNSNYLSNLLHQSNRAANQQVLASSATDIQHYFSENLPIIGIAFRNQVLFTARHLSGDFHTSSNSIFWNVQSWHIE